LQIRIKALESQRASYHEEKKQLLDALDSVLNLGRHIYLPQMGCIIVHAQISCLIRVVGGYREAIWTSQVLRNCRFIRFCCHHFPGHDNTAFIDARPSRVREHRPVDGVYMGSFVAQRIQRAWRGYMVRRRRMALCMASNSRLGAGASPLLGAVIRVLCVEDLVRIV
jgi:hypothetical protein